MGECFAHGGYIGTGACPKCAELGKKGELAGHKTRSKLNFRYTGKGECRWCGKKPEPPRRTWCSQACVDDYQIRSDPKVARAAVAKRDQGVCAMCAMDTKALRHRVTLMYRSAVSMLDRCHRQPIDLEPNELSGAARAGWRLASIYRYNEAAQLLREHGIHIPNLGARDPFARADPLVGSSCENPRSLWQMDHTVPVTEGGAGCGLENLRTLCIPCHKKETSRLAAYQARKRAEEAAAEQERIAPRLPYID